MIDLYALTSPNVIKIFIALEELALPYKVHLVDVWKSEQYNPEFLKLNPNAKIPVIVDHEGPGGKPYTVFESGAILLYLAEKTGKLMPKDMAKRYEVIQWLMIQLTTIGPQFGQFFHYTRFAPPGNDYALNRFRTEVKRLYDLMEKRLGEVEYLGGDEYSIADIATFPWTRNHELHGITWSTHPNVGRWYEAIANRPAVKVTLPKVDAIKTARDNANPDDVDRFFGRGRYTRA